jgi:hypothetical protein
VSEQDALDEQLSEVWQALSPPAGLEAKVRARLVGASGAAAGTEAVAARRSSGVARRLQALRASGGVGAGAGAVLLVLGFLAGYVARPPSNERSPEPLGLAVPAPDIPSVGSPSAPANGSAAALAASAPEVAPAPGETPPEAAPRAEPAGGALPVVPQARPRAKETRPVQRAAGRARAESDAAHANQELLLLERAERAVRAHNPDLALVLAGEIEDRYPGSQLHEERRAIELMALCQAGSSLALELGERFARRYPGSVYGERIANECGAAPTNRSALDIDGVEGGNNAKPKKP